MGRDKAIILFISRYDFTNKYRRHMFYRLSEDQGRTWSERQLFDAEPSRRSYYMTNVIPTTDGPPGGAALPQYDLALRR